MKSPVIYNLANDIKLFCVTAKSFPDGILAAHQKLHSLLPTTKGRNFYGISYPDQDSQIIYKACVEESYPGEAEKYGCEIFILEKGDYISNYISNFPQNIDSIKETFDNLLAYPDIHPQGCCVEQYLSESDMRCMVRLKSSNKSNKSIMEEKL